MKIFHGYEQIKESLPQSIVTIGNFDGVHLGHQYLFNRVREEAKKINGITVVFSFWPHPAKVFSPNKKFLCIQSLEQRIAHIEKSQVDVLVLQSFNIEFSKLSSKEFLYNYIITPLRPKKLVLGYDFRCGFKQLGDIKKIKETAMLHKIDVISEPAFKIDGEIVSSRGIRDNLANKQLNKAKKLLGKPYRFEGTVIKGLERGRTLGFPTANLQGDIDICLPRGVYIAKAIYKDQSYLCVVNIGQAPTFDKKSETIEAHLLNFDKDIYNEKLSLDFIEFLRLEKRFSSPNELIKQIKKDILRAKTYQQ